MTTRLNRAAAAVGGLAIAASFAVSCAATKEAAQDVASSAASVGSSAASVVSSGASVAGSAASSGASAAGSAVSSGASVASSAATSGASVAGSAVSSGASVASSAVSSGASVASSVVSSVLDRAPETAKDATEATKSGLKWWWIPVGIALAALLASLLRTLTRRKPEPVKAAVQRAPEVKTTRRVDDDRDRHNN